MISKIEFTNVEFTKNVRKKERSFYEDGYIWYPIKSIEYIGKNNVYDIEVEDSNGIRLIYEVKPDGGKKLKAEIILSIAYGLWLYVCN